MEIRKATTADAATLSALNVVVQKIHADAQPHIFKQPADDTFAVAYMLEQLADPASHFFMATLNGEDIGYILARIVKRPENPFMVARQYLYIDQIAVKPAHQRTGCGQRLLAEVLALAAENEIDTIALDVWSFNQQAQSFFKKQGFTLFNERMWLTQMHENL
jgi:ribosomal protein S18 acetylase RimI-like enzyme